MVVSFLDGNRQVDVNASTAALGDSNFSVPVLLGKIPLLCKPHLSRDAASTFYVSRVLSIHMMPIIVSVVIVLAFLGFIATGYKDGLIQTLGRMLDCSRGVCSPPPWSTAVAGILAKFLPANWSQFIAIVAIFVIASRAGGRTRRAILEVTFRIITILPIIKTINKLAGVVAGAVEGVVMIGGIIWVLKTTTAFRKALKWLDGAFMADFL